MRALPTARKIVLFIETFLTLSFSLCPCPYNPKISLPLYFSSRFITAMNSSTVFLVQLIIFSSIFLQLSMSLGRSKFPRPISIVFPKKREKRMNFVCRFSRLCFPSPLFLFLTLLFRFFFLSLSFAYHAYHAFFLFFL